MRATVVLFPGSNADSEMVRTLRDVMGISTTVTWHKDTAFTEPSDLVVLPGGFSYGDYLRCGAIAKASPIVGAIRAHADAGGLILGVCNGFQILTELGLLPGALTRNEHMRFECRDVFVTPADEGPFTRGLPKVLKLPIAHAEGRYQLAAADRSRVHVAFRYCDRSGTVGENPNGSLDHIAGVYGGANRNVMGLMPHPERQSEPLHGGSDGRLLFESAVASLANKAAA